MGLNVKFLEHNNYKVDMYSVTDMAPDATTKRGARIGAKNAVVGILIDIAIAAMNQSIINRKIEGLKDKIVAKMPPQKNGGVLLVLYTQEASKNDQRYIGLSIVDAGTNMMGMIRVNFKRKVRLPALLNGSWKYRTRYIWITRGK